MFSKFYQVFTHYVNIKLAFAGAFILGAVVYYLNMPHGHLLASSAALKQASYTFLASGFLTRHNEKLAIRGTNRCRALFLAAGSSAGIAIALTFLVHSLKGTPEVFLSTLPTILTAPFSFLFLAWREQGKVESWQ